jgi:hypothetical protein
MKRQSAVDVRNERAQLDVSRKLRNLDFTIEALKTDVEKRTPAQAKDLKQFVHYHVALMEGGYCTNDDYQFLSERLKYRFVKKGQYAVR